MLPCKSKKNTGVSLEITELELEIKQNKKKEEVKELQFF